MSQQHEVRNERAAAPVLFLLCSDHRHNRSEDRVILERGIDELAATVRLVKPGEPVEFDVIQVPGPARGLGLGDHEGEQDLLVWYSNLLLELHGGELVVVSFHWECGREGEHGTDRGYLEQNMLKAIQYLIKRFPHHMFAGLGIDIRDGRTHSVETYSPVRIGEIITMLESGVTPTVHVEPTTRANAAASV